MFNRGKKILVLMEILMEWVDVGVGRMVKENIGVMGKWLRDWGVLWWCRWCGGLSCIGKRVKMRVLL
ncbi:hypothetical protein, partial [Paenibacillus xylanexedens]|uniref:hypothetical protein n=1 Tax=Paenibacillus xylanexedens TaxID=528191 RepID=UPI001C92D1F1